MRIWRIRTGISIKLDASDRCRLEAIVRDRIAPQKQVWRARIVLDSAAGLGTVEIMRRTGKSKTCVWRWQERFTEEGVAGLLRAKTRPSRGKPLAQSVIDQVVALTASDPPHEALSLDEKSQIQALDRTQPGLPMKKGRAGTMSHDYKRNGTTTLFAALSIDVWRNQRQPLGERDDGGSILAADVSGRSRGNHQREAAARELWPIVGDGRSGGVGF